MRSLFIFSLLPLMLVAFAPQAQAQMRLGLRAGLNVSNFAGGAAGGTEARLGPHVGLTATYALPAGLYLQPEVLYSQKGANRSDGQGAYSFSYIDIPVHLGFSVQAGNNLFARLYAGPQLGVKSSGSARSAGTSVAPAKGTDVALSFGADAGARRFNRTSEFGIGLRYALGLTDIFEVEGVSDMDFEAVAGSRNRVLSVTAFYRF